MQTLVHCAVKHSRPPDCKSSSHLLGLQVPAIELSSSEEVIEDEPAIKISNLQLELKSIKSQSDNTLARLTQIENRFDNRLNQIENRFANLEGRLNKPEDDYYYDPDY